MGFFNGTPECNKKHSFIELSLVHTRAVPVLRKVPYEDRFKFSISKHETKKNKVKSKDGEI